MKSYSACLISFVCLMLLPIAGCKKHLEQPPAQTVKPESTPLPPLGNPPVVIVGGSIHGKYDNHWLTASATEYDASAPNDSMLYFVNVYDGGASAVAPISAGSGWVINFYDQHSDKTPQSSPGAQLCSDHGCQGVSEDGTSVYFQPSRLNTGLELYLPTEIHFHSYDNKCDKHGSKSEDKKCDHIHHIGIVLAGGTETRYDCGGHQGKPQGKCEIWVGEAPE